MPAISSEAVSELKSSLSTSAIIVTPDSDNFKESLKRWAASSEKTAAIVVYPTSAEDVSKIVLFSIAHSIEIAVCCGGHSTGGFSSTEGGLSIDLSKMRDCTVEAEKKTVSVQGGALWRDVDEALAPHNLAAVGGTVNHTGVGGLTLGGGYGWLTPQRGLTIDNLLSVEYCLASGEILTASSTENTDLFWGARGAGSAFGVATNFVFQAHDQKNAVWAGMVVFPPTQLKEVIGVSNQLINNCTGVVLFYDGSEEEGRKFYEALLRLKPLMDMTSTMPYVNVNSMMNDMNPFGFRRTMKGTATLAPVQGDWAETLFQDFVQFTTEVPEAKGSVMMFEFISPRRILEVSQTDTAFASRGEYFNLVFASAWTGKENDAVCREWTRSMAAKGKAYLRSQMEKGTDDVTKDAVGAYANYDSVGEKGQVLFGINYPRLAELKRRYDPGNVFNKNLNLI